MRLTIASVLCSAVLGGLSGDGAPRVAALLGGAGAGAGAGASPRATLDRAVFTAAPLELNTSQYQFVLDPTIKINGDWDVRARARTRQLRRETA